MSKLSKLSMLGCLPPEKKKKRMLSLTVIPENHPDMLIFIFFHRQSKNCGCEGKNILISPSSFPPSFQTEKSSSPFLCCVRLPFYSSGLWNQNSHWHRIRDRLKILEVVLKSWKILQKLYAFSRAELILSSDLIFPAADLPFILCDRTSPIGEITAPAFLKFCNSYFHSGTKMGHTLNPVYTSFINVVIAFIMQMVVCKKTYLLDVNFSCSGSLSLCNI